MRKVATKTPPFNTVTTSAETKFLFDAIAELQRATNEDVPADIAMAYTISNYTETRTLDAATATVTDVANVLATLLRDIRAGSVKRGQ